MVGDTAELVARARLGDQDAFAALVRPYYDELLVHGYRLLGSTAEAEDCLQEALTRAWLGLAGYQEQGYFRAWLYRIMTNRCLTAAEQRRRRELPTGLDNGSVEETPWLEPLPGSRLDHAVGWDPEARLLARDSVRLAFVAAIQRLPPSQRAVLILRDVLGFTAAETADLLGITVVAVNSALQRARRQSDTDVQVHPADPSETHESARRYLRAWENADVDAIVAMLADDARYSMPPLPSVYVGATAIREFLITGPLSTPNQSWRFLPARANGQIAFGTYLCDDNSGSYEPAGLDIVSFTHAGLVSEVVSFLNADFSEFGLPALLPPR